MIEIEVDNYRAVRRARCAFEPGVTVVVGANGAGKTTLLDVPSVLRHAALHGLREALAHHGGLAARTWGVRGESVRLRIKHGRLRWELIFANEGETLADLQERLWVDDAESPYATQGVGDVIGRVGDEPFGLLGGGPAAWSGARAKLTTHEGDFQQLAHAELYTDYAVRDLRVRGSVATDGYPESHLHASGRNAFIVLRNWRDQPRSRGQHEFVISSLGVAFPGFRELAFQGGGQAVYGGFVFERDLDRMEPALTAANGVLVALLHLTAVASTPRGGYVGIDEIENGLHPFAIRVLLDAIEARAVEHDVCVVIATHSPIVLDHFQARPERIIVRAPECAVGFRSLTDIEDRDFLNDFSLGRMYGSGKFGAPIQ